jgi:hypothetical protein
VQAGHVRVSVVGTVFTVRRTEGEVDVEVIEGVVRVTDGDAETTLRAGERRVFRASDAVGAALPPSTSAVALAPEAGEGSELEESVTAPRVLPREDPTEDPAEETPAEETAPDGDSPDDAAHSAWTALAEEGRFDEGYALLLQDREVLRSDDIETLMEAADCARHSGHPAESLAYLFRAREVGGRAILARRWCPSRWGASSCPSSTARAKRPRSSPGPASSLRAARSPPMRWHVRWKRGPRAATPAEREPARKSTFRPIRPASTPMRCDSMEDWNRAQRAIGLGVLIALTPAALAAQDAPAGLPQVSLTIEGGCTTLDEAGDHPGARAWSCAASRR